MSAVIDIEAGHLAIVQRILREFGPPGAVVWVFGSRVKGRARAASDLDLAIDAGRALSLSETGALAEAFDEAPLPYRVDVVDLHSISAEFRAIVERDMLPLTEVVS